VRCCDAENVCVHHLDEAQLVLLAWCGHHHHLLLALPLPRPRTLEESVLVMSILCGPLAKLPRHGRTHLCGQRNLPTWQGQVCAKASGAPLIQNEERSLTFSCISSCSMCTQCMGVLLLLLLLQHCRGLVDRLRRLLQLFLLQPLLLPPANSKSAETSTNNKCMNCALYVWVFEGSVLSFATASLLRFLFQIAQIVPQQNANQNPIATVNKRRCTTKQ
jgi:hypothetical protein